MSENVGIEPTSEEGKVTQPYLAGIYDAYLTYMALGGLLTDDEGRITKMTIGQFCEEYGVSDQTLRRWKREPGFAMKVRERRGEIVPLARETKAYNQLYMLGMQTKDKRAAVDALKTYLGHAGNLQLPVQRQDVHVEGGFADMLMAASREGIIEGEVVSTERTELHANPEPSADERGSAENPALLPGTS